MNLWLILTTAVLTVVTGQENNLQFSSDETALFKCILSQDLFNGERHSEFAEIKKSIANFTTQRLSGKTVSRGEINEKVRSLITELSSGDMSVFKQVPWTFLQTGTIKALIKCSSKNNDELNLSDVLGKWLLLIDYILVDWPQDMFCTKNGRALLRRYATNA